MAEVTAQIERFEEALDFIPLRGKEDFPWLLTALGRAFLLPMALSSVASVMVGKLNI